jgi:hypothetical protein
MTEIYKRINTLYDKELETEWLVFFMMEAIIKMETIPLLYIYTYRKFNMIKTFKNNSAMYNKFYKHLKNILYYVIAHSIVILIIICFVLFDNIEVTNVVIMCIIPILLILIGCCIDIFLCYRDIKNIYKTLKQQERHEKLLYIV